MAPKTKKFLHDELVDLTRMWPTLLAFVVTLGFVWWIAPQQIGIVVYTICKLLLAGYVGYWIDRWTFPCDRPAAPDPKDVADNPVMAQMRRAFIIGCCVIASGLMS